MDETNQPLLESEFKRVQDEAGERARRELKDLPHDALAWLVAVPHWTSEAIQAVRFPVTGSSRERFLDGLVANGWVERQPSFIPGHTDIAIYGPSESSFLQGLVQKLGGSAAKHEGSAVEPITRIVVPSARLRLTASTVAFRADQALALNGATQFNFTAFSDKPKPLSLTGVVTTCEGDAWQGFEATVSIDTGSRTGFTLALYDRFNLAPAQRAELTATPAGNSWWTGCYDAAQALWQAPRHVVVALPTVTRHWLAVARHLDRTKGADAAARLIQLVDWLTKRNRLGLLRSLLDAADILAQTVRGEIEMAARLGRRRLELHERNQMDRRKLRYFVERQEQIRCFDEILRPNSPTWAMHYFGLGGMGKTMLLRFLQNRTLTEGRSVARIDFDYLTPDYPVRRPAQLLLELADSLRLHVSSSTAEQAYRSFLSMAQGIHNEVESQDCNTDPDPLTNLRRPGFNAVLAAFSDFLKFLPQPVVLFLDTCEELARLQPDGRFQPAVQATFNILERIRGAADGPAIHLCVVFAGRRLLALTGANYEAVGAELSERRAQFAGNTDQTLHKDYLLLHEIRGFEYEDAVAYLQSRQPRPPGEPNLLDDPLAETFDRSAPVSSHAADERISPLEQAMLEKSVDRSIGADIHWHDGRGREGVRRFNPFDLALFTDWRDAVPDLDAKTIRKGGTDPYVEIRIIGRLQKQKRIGDLVPLILLLRRFNKHYLAGFVPARREELDAVYQELCQIEWIDYFPGDGHTGSWLEVNRQLLPRLLRYFDNRERGSQLTSARENIVQWLKTQLDGVAANTKPDEAFLAIALRLLPVPQGAAYWAKINRRVMRESDWHWVTQVCAHLLAEEDAIPPLLRAAVGATHAVAERHLGLMDNLSIRWQLVSDQCADQTTALAVELRDRAVAGLISARLSSGHRVEPKLVQSFWKIVAQRPSPNWADAIGALLDFAGVFAPSEKELWDEAAFQHWKLDGQVKSVAVLAELFVLLRCRLGWGGDRSEIIGAARHFHEAFGQGETKPNDTLDWPMPANLRFRLRLEILDTQQWLADISESWAGMFVVEDTLRKWFLDALGAATEPDAAWLMARIIDHDSVAATSAEISGLESIIGGTPFRPPRTAAQVRTPSPFVAIAGIMTGQGAWDRGLALLDRHLDVPDLQEGARRSAVQLKATILLEHGMPGQILSFLAQQARENFPLLDTTLLQQLKLAAAGPKPKISHGRRWRDRFPLLGKIIAGAGIAIVCYFSIVLLIASIMSAPSAEVGLLLGTASLVGWMVLLRLSASPVLLIALNMLTGIVVLLGAIVIIIEMIERSTLLVGGWEEALIFMLAMIPAILITRLSHRWAATFNAMPHRRARAWYWFKAEPSGLSANPIVAHLVRLDMYASWWPEIWGRALVWLGMPLVFLKNIFRSAPKRGRAMSNLGFARSWPLPAKCSVETGRSGLYDGEPRPEREIPPVISQDEKPDDEAWRHVVRQFSRHVKVCMPVALELGPEIAPFNLESVLARKIAPDVVLPASLGFYRARPNSPWYEWPRFWQREGRAISVVPPKLLVWPEWVDLVGGAWNQGAKDRMVHSLERWLLNIPLFSRNKFDDFQVRHLVGEPMRVGQKVHFRWQPGEAATATSITAATLSRQGNGFIILQDVPAEYQFRTDTDLRRTNDLRDFAHELFTGGMWGVLLVPALSPQIAADLTFLIARTFAGNRPPGIDALLKLVAELRRHVHQHAPSMLERSPRGEREALALAWDITLFIHDDHPPGFKTDRHVSEKIPAHRE